MKDKRFCLVKCIYNQWGIVDKSLESIDQLILMAENKNNVNGLVLLLNQLYEDKQDYMRERNQLLKRNYELEHKVFFLNEELNRITGEDK